MTTRVCQVQDREDGSDSRPLSLSLSLHSARHEATTFSIGYSNSFGQTQPDFTGSTQPLRTTSSAIHIRSRINSSFDD